MRRSLGIVEGESKTYSIIVCFYVLWMSNIAVIAIAVVFVNQFPVCVDVIVRHMCNFGHMEGVRLDLMAGFS